MKGSGLRDLTLCCRQGEQTQEHTLQVDDQGGTSIFSSHMQVCAGMLRGVVKGPRPAWRDTGPAAVVPGMGQLKVDYLRTQMASRDCGCSCALIDAI